MPTIIKRSQEVRDKHKKYMEKQRKLYPDRYKKIAQRYYKNNTDKIKLRQKEFRDRLRNVVLEFYGNKCICCGETQREFLSIDHKNDDGYIHREKIGNGGGLLIRWIIKNNFPKDLQLLCHNCNMAKSLYGICPHRKEKEDGIK